MGRITKVSHCYYESPRRNTPLEVTCRSTRNTEVDDQPYVRERIASNTWEKADTGWLYNAGLLVIENRAKHDSGQVLELVLATKEYPPDGTVVTPHLLLSPRESFEGRLGEGVCILVRSHDGKPVEYTITAFPG